MNLRSAFPILVTLLGVLPLLGAAAIVVDRELSRPTRTLRDWNLVLRFERAGWTHDQMNHGGNGFQMPSQMLPDLPLPGQHRYTFEFSVFNAGTVPLEFGTAELVLHSPHGTRWPSGAAFDTVPLAPGHGLTSMVTFDVADGDESVVLGWERNGAWQRILETRSPPAAKLPALVDTEWPKDVARLPPGNAQRGQALFTGRLACFTCHGTPGAPGQSTVGPPLDGVGRIAQTRVPGLSAAQYLYESLLHPDAFVAPVCARGQPCEQPSTMPFYGEVMSLGDMADLVAFLATQTQDGSAR